VTWICLFGALAPRAGSRRQRLHRKDIVVHEITADGEPCNAKFLTSILEIDMKRVAQFAVSKGWPLPKPADPLDTLAKLFSDAR
jgi:hypothetical protein